ncbi:MAG TPA: hypothetical protein EYN66_14530, partial [Myxococcales bacterium]|nr:hypothetical protein [Myxococcales bacterium]
MIIIITLIIAVAQAGGWPYVTDYYRASSVEEMHTLIPPPESNFLREITLYSQEVSPPKGVVAQLVSTHEADIIDMAAAMPEAPSFNKLVWTYARAEPATDLSAYPVEFQLYAQGAVKLHQDRSEEASLLFKQLLDLPEGKRQYRSTWAAYMLARTVLNIDEQVSYYNEVIDLVSDGYKDTLGLGTASLRHLARLYFIQERPDKMTVSCMQYFASGGNNSPFCKDLERALKQLIDEDIPEQYADNDIFSNVISIYLASNRFKQAGGWIDILNRRSQNTRGAALLALAAYQRGEF